MGLIEQIAADLQELKAWKAEKEVKDERWRKLSDRWIKGTQEAADILGVSRSTLEALRSKPGTLIRWKKEGTTACYLLSSLQDHSDSIALNHLKIAV